MIETLKSLNLTKPICFYDCETTGLDVAKDRIISISITKLMPDGTTEYKSALINPTINVKPDALEVHGITNEMLINKPLFKQLAKSLREFFGDCILAGFNIKYFDNQILQEEFLRCGIDFPNETILSIDSCLIFKYFEKRDLTTAYKFYCDKDLENAHDADSDTKATLEVFAGQLQRYEELQGKTIAELAKIGTNENNVDAQGRITKDADGDYCWGFGKQKGQKIKTQLGFGDWVLMNDFPESFKNLVVRVMAEIKKK